MIVSGQLLAYISNATFNDIWGGENTWRWMLALSIVPAVLLWIGMIFMPETPRWHVMKGRSQAAREVLEKPVPPKMSSGSWKRLRKPLKRTVSVAKAACAISPHPG